jgi:hypothetical protein
LEIFKCDSIRNVINELIKHDHVNFELIKRLNIKDIKILQNLINCNRDNVASKHVDLFFSYLFELGYLSFSGDKNKYKLPNQEIETEFKRLIQDYYIDNYKLTRNDIDDAIKKLNNLIVNREANGILDLKESLTNLFKPLQLRSMQEKNEVGVHPNEDLFHSIVNFLCIQSTGCKFGTEVRGVGKRPDIVIINIKVKVGLIIELKYNKTSKAALDQALIKYKDFISNREDVEIVKFIGINISSDKEVTIEIKTKTEDPKINEFNGLLDEFIKLFGTKDSYEVLNLNKSATTIEISKALEESTSKCQALDKPNKIVSNFEKLYDIIDGENDDIDFVSPALRKKD